MSTTIKGFTNKTMINQEAAQWILLLEDTPKLSKKQVEELNAWVSTSSVHRECLESMVQSWGEMDLLSKVMLPLEVKSPSMISIMMRYLLMPLVASYHIILGCIQQSKKLFNAAIYTPILLSGLVATVIFIVQPLDENNNLILSTNMGEHQSHTMPDGSILWLNSSTAIKVNYTETFRRIKLMTGEAHFEVAKDATRPFEVYVNDRLVRAIGTAFSVHKLNNNIEVIVSEGVVELAVIDDMLVVIPDDVKAVKVVDDLNNKKSEKRNNIPNSLDNKPTNIKKLLGKLSAGQRISIPIEIENINEVVELDSSEITRSLSWRQGKLVFAGESLEDVIEEITRHTTVKIDVLDPQLKSMRIGGQFQLGETDTLFYVLESGFGIKVNKLNSRHVQLLLKE